MNDACPQHHTNCEGLIYIALHQWGMPFTKIGFTHSIPALTRRNKDLTKAGFKIVWNSGLRDAKDLPWSFSDEQAIHALIAQIQPAYSGIEYYEISRPLITIIDTLLLERHRNQHSRRQAINDLAKHLRFAWFDTSYDTGQPG